MSIGISSSELKTTQVVNEFLSGLTIALLLIPESIAFAYILGLSPETGIHNTMVEGDRLAVRNDAADNVALFLRAAVHHLLVPGCAWAPECAMLSKRLVC